MEHTSSRSEQMVKLDVHNLEPQNFFPNGVIVPTPNSPTPSGFIASTPSTKSAIGSNPFYRPTLTFEAAAEHLFKIIKAALAASESWLKVSVDSVCSAANAQAHENHFIRMCGDFKNILFFLQHGRNGWDLEYLPDNFFADVEGLLPTLLIRVEGLSDIDGCDFLYQSGVITLRDVQTKLREIAALRKETWTRSKEKYERQQDAENVQRPSEAGNGD